MHHPRAFNRTFVVFLNFLPPLYLFFFLCVQSCVSCQLVLRWSIADPTFTVCVKLLVWFCIYSFHHWKYQLDFVSLQTTCGIAECLWRGTYWHIYTILHGWFNNISTGHVLLYSDTLNDVAAMSNKILIYLVEKCMV